MTTHQRVHAWLVEQWEPVSARQVRLALGFKSRSGMLARLSELECSRLVTCVGHGKGGTKLWVALDAA